MTLITVTETPLHIPKPDRSWVSRKGTIVDGPTGTPDTVSPLNPEDRGPVLFRTFVPHKEN